MSRFFKEPMLNCLQWMIGATTYGLANYHFDEELMNFLQTYCYVGPIDREINGLEVTSWHVCFYLLLGMGAGLMTSFLQGKFVEELISTTPRACPSS